MKHKRSREKTQTYVKFLKQYYERLSPASGRPVILDPFQSTFCALLGYEALLLRSVDDTNSHRLFLDRIFPETAAGNGIQNNSALAVALTVSNTLRLGFEISALS